MTMKIEGMGKEEGRGEVEWMYRRCENVVVATAITSSTVDKSCERGGGQHMYNWQVRMDAAPTSSSESSAVDALEPVSRDGALAALAADPALEPTAFDLAAVGGGGVVAAAAANGGLG